MNKSLALIVVLFAMFLSSCMCYVPWAKGFVGCCLPSGLSCQTNPKANIEEKNQSKEEKETREDKSKHYVY